jgi:hypothetical protein
MCEREMSREELSFDSNRQTAATIVLLNVKGEERAQQGKGKKGEARMHTFTNKYGKAT